MNVTPQSNPEIVDKLTLNSAKVNLVSVAKRCAKLFAIFSAVGAIGFGFYYYSLKTRMHALVESEQTNIIRLSEQRITDKFASILSDIRYLANLPQLIAFVGDANSLLRQSVALEFKVFAEQKPIYAQIRYINSQGMEVIRIDHLDKRVRIVPDKVLQDKSKRYYFFETLKLSVNQIYVSPFDLNIEQEKIEYPINPTIRFAMPVFDSSGGKQGIVVINYHGQQLIDQLNAISVASYGNLWLVNSRGYWLIGSNSENEWGFMFPNRDQKSLTVQYPDLWNRIISSSASGNIYFGEEFFAYDTILPLESAIRQAPTRTVVTSFPVQAPQYEWHLVAYVSDEKWRELLRPHIHYLLWLYGGWLFIGLVLTGWISRSDALCAALTGLFTESKWLFSNLVESINVGVYRLSTVQGYRFIEVNPAMVKIFEADSHDELINSSVMDMFFSRDSFVNFERLLHEQSAVVGEEYEMVTRKGRRVFMSLTARLYNDQDGNKYVDGVLTDISELKRVKEATRLISILEASPDCVSIFNQNLQIRYMNDACRSMLQIEPMEDVTTLTLENILPEWAWSKLKREALPTALSAEMWHGESTLRNRENKIIPVSQVIITHRDESGKVEYFSTIIRDISEIKSYEEQLKHQVTHESITGLPNRILIYEKLEQEIFYASMQNRMVGVIYLDVDNFQRINQLLGHEAGDDALCAIRDHLLESLGGRHVIGKLGGDQFIVLVGGVSTLDTIYNVINSIRHTFKVPLIVDTVPIYFTFSIGVSVFPKDATHTDDLVKAAYVAMHGAKTSGRNTYMFHQAEMNIRGREWLNMEAELRDAIKYHQFSVYYQPQWDVFQGRVSRVEALIRWLHPQRGLIEPNIFVPILEETGLIVDVGEWILRVSCAQAKKWHLEKNLYLQVAVNLSAKQLRNKNLLPMVQHILDDEKLQANYLAIEITESIVMNNLDEALDILHGLKQLGVEIDVDDFGTGYSSLSYLKTFPIDTLKIDKSFIHDLPENTDDAAITSAIIQLGKNLGLKVVAEGVETEAQKMFLRELSCSYLQGNFICKPLPADEITTYVSNIV